MSKQGYVTWPSPVVSAIIGILAVLWSGPGRAQTFTLGVTQNAPDLGNIVGSSAGDTVYTIASSTGAVTRVSGSAQRLTSASTTPVLFTIGCTGGSNPNKCKNEDLEVVVTLAGSPSGKARALSSFTASTGPSGLTGYSAVTGANSITISGSGVPQGGTRNFYVGMNFTIQGNDTAVPTGFSAASFSATLYDARGNALAFTTGSARAFVMRPIAVTKSSDLRFGYVNRPNAGSSIVALDPSSVACTRSITGSGALISSPSGCATFTVGGEPGGAFSLSTPTSFEMIRSGGSDSITVNLTSSGTSGVVGTFDTFRVGGSFNADAATPAGTYSGAFVVVVQYN